MQLAIICRVLAMTATQGMCCMLVIQEWQLKPIELRVLHLACPQKGSPCSDPWDWGPQWSQIHQGILAVFAGLFEV